MPKESCSSQQFKVIYRVFLLRVVDVGMLGAEADTTKLLGQVASLFAAVSFLFTAPLLLAGRLPQGDLWTMEHLLLATTMVVVGLISVLSWDAIFPDRLDVLVLGPLPVPTRTFFFGKIAAIAVALGLAMLALNVFSGFVWPLLFSPDGSGVAGAFRSIAAYWATTLAAGSFVFFSILVLRGLASQLLSRQIFLRLSAWIQTVSFSLLLGVYLLEPSLENVSALNAPQNQQVLGWLPTYWFLGLFQQMNGSLLPAFAPLARRAWLGLLISVAGGGTAILFAYFRTMPKLIEQPDILPRTHRRERSVRFGGLRQIAIAEFSVRTLMRSGQHRVLFAFYIGVGFAVTLAYTGMTEPSLRSSRLVPAGLSLSFLVASLLMICFAVLGTRIVFSLPVTLQANWIFRMTEAGPVNAYVAGVRRAMMLIAVLPVGVAFVFASMAKERSWQIPIHLLVLGLLGSSLVDLSLLSFSKLPFTCSYLPGRGRLHLVFWCGVFVLLPLVNQIGRLELYLLNSRLGIAALLGASAVVAASIHQGAVSATTKLQQLRFDEEYPVDILELGLSDLIL